MVENGEVLHRKGVRSGEQRERSHGLPDSQGQLQYEARLAGSKGKGNAELKLFWWKKSFSYP